MSERRPNRLSAWVASAVLACAATMAVGQAQIPASVISNTNVLSEAEKKVVADYVAAHSANLQSTNPIQVKNDRAALLDPLKGADVSAPFRLEYSSQVLPRVTPMMSSQTEMVVINGLVIAGELATDGALNTVQQKMTDKAASIRYQAAYAVSRTFEAAGRTPKAASDTALMGAARGLQQVIAGEKNPLVLDSMIRAGVAGAQLDGIKDLKDTAVMSVCKGVTTAASNMQVPGDVKEVGDLLRAATDMRDVAAKAVQQSKYLNHDAAVAAGEMGGVLIARTAAALNGNLPQGALRDAYAQVASAAQTLVQLSGQNLQPGGDFAIKDKDGRPISLSESVKKGTVAGDANFRQDAQKIIGRDEGLLIKPPFELPAEKFNK